MSLWTQILFILLAVFLGWQLYAYIHRHPQLFSRENLSRSIFTLGILALFLIAFIAILVLLVRS
jgi:hypothetical protein